MAEVAAAINSIYKQYILLYLRYIIIVTLAESLNRDLVRVNALCDLWGMKLNASKTKTMIVSRSRTMHPQSPKLTIDGTVLKESDDRDILGVTFDSKLTFEKNLRSVSRTASQRRPGRYSMISCSSGDAFGVLSCQFWNTVLQCGVRLPIRTLNYWTA